MASLILPFAELKVGEFYLPLFERIEPCGTDFHEKYRTDSPFYKYLGNGQFETESGTPVDRFYDPELGLDVAVDAADGFIQ